MKVTLSELGKLTLRPADTKSKRFEGIQEASEAFEPVRRAICEKGMSVAEVDALIDETFQEVHPARMHYWDTSAHTTPPGICPYTAIRYYRASKSPNTSLGILASRAKNLAIFFSNTSASMGTVPGHTSLSGMDLPSTYRGVISSARGRTVEA